MMFALDMLHKLYASTALPIVWARSTGVEVLNELDVLKSGIIGAAGGHSSTPARGGGPGIFWDAVANGVETLVDGTRVARVMERGLRSAVGCVMQQLARAASRPGSDGRE
jgi:ubiquinone biosynthesis monooxygenase Coq6